MPVAKFTRKAQEIIKAYETVRQVGGEGTIVQRVAKFLGRPVDSNGGHSQIRRTILRYQQSRKTD